MSLTQSSSNEARLQRIKYEIYKSGRMKEIASRIGERRGWRKHRDEEKQLERWARNVNQMLDGLDCNRHWSYLDHRDAIDVLGFDPAEGDDARKAA